MAIATNKDLRIISMKLSPEEPASTNRQIADQSSKYNVSIGSTFKYYFSQDLFKNPIQNFRYAWPVVTMIMAQQYGESVGMLLVLF